MLNPLISQTHAEVTQFHEGFGEKITIPFHVDNYCPKPAQLNA